MAQAAHPRVPGPTRRLSATAKFSGTRTTWYPALAIDGRPPGHSYVPHCWHKGAGLPSGRLGWFGHRDCSAGARSLGMHPFVDNW